MSRVQLEQGFDTTEIDEFTKELLAMAQETIPKESKKFIRKEGTKLKWKTKREAKKKVNDLTGNYYESIERGSPYLYKGQLMSIRVYSSAHHAHLIEHGHVIITHGMENGMTKGKYVFKDASEDFKKIYYRDCRKFVDEVFGGW